MTDITQEEIDSEAMEQAKLWDREELESFQREMQKSIDTLTLTMKRLKTQVDYVCDRSHELLT